MNPPRVELLSARFAALEHRAANFPALGTWGDVCRWWALSYRAVAQNAPADVAAYLRQLAEDEDANAERIAARTETFPVYANSTPPRHGI